MKYKLRTASVIGPGHIQTNTPNQDYSLTREWNNSWLAVVSDGMGSRRLSHIGSRLACKAAFQIAKKSSFDISDREFITLIYQRWLALLGDISPKDAVATCLIAWGYNDHCRLFQLGDGVIFVHNQSPFQLTQKSEISFGNETTGLGISKKLSDWQYCKITLEQAYHGIVLMTDGISDDIAAPEAFTLDVIQNLKNKSIRYAKLWMSNELRHWPTPKHTDDKTIAVIYRK